MTKPFVNNRGFFRRLMGGNAVKLSFFAAQVVFDAAGQEALRKRLQVALDAPGSETPEEKRAYFKTLTSILLEAEPFFEYGYFEYVIEAEDAEDGFDEWVSEIQASMATEEEEIGDEVDDYHRISDEQCYIVVSLLLLVEGPHPFDSKNEEDEDEFYTRAGMGSLIDSVNRYNFEKVVSDAAFLIPGSEEDGFSWSDFADDDWKYLKMLRS